MLSFRSYTSFFEKYLNFFFVFPSVSHLVDNYTKIVDERGRNLMCDRKLPSDVHHLVMRHLPGQWTIWRSHLSENIKGNKLGIIAHFGIAIAHAQLLFDIADRLLE